MLRKFCFQLHWLIGLSAGLVLALVGVTGGLLSFEAEILRLLNPRTMQVTPAAAPLAPDAFLARVREVAPERSINWLRVSAAPTDAAEVNFADGGRRGQTVLADPYTGELLGQPRGRALFVDIMRLHRWLLAGEVGKQIVGASTVALILLCLSGLYLRWPRRLLNWRAWLTFSVARKGRAFLWDLHAVLGTWALLLYLLAALSGLYWSYEWYRDGLYALSGVERPARRGDPSPGQGRSTDVPVRLADAWTAFASTTPYSTARLQLPRTSEQPIVITYLDPAAPHERAFNRMTLDPTGTVLAHARYADKPLTEKLMGSMLPLHSGSFFGDWGRIAMMIASLGMPLFALTGWMLYLDRRRNRQAARAAARPLGATVRASGGASVLLAYASQSGTAERHAWLSAGSLQAAGVPVQVRALNQLVPEDLMRVDRALFALATFGDGTAPDNARAFVRRMRATGPALGNLRFGVLAFGDSSHPRFCGFARSVTAWLKACGAQPLFDAIEVDREAPEALLRWQRQLADLFGAAGMTTSPEDTAFLQWRLVARHCLNPGSPKRRVYHLELTPPEGCALDWQTGDIAQVRLADGATRDYSIASVPEDGRIHLLVRRVRRPDGRLGAGSGWLTARLPEGGDVALRIRPNPGFRAPQTGPLILIGNGTGIAGLRAHLRARERHGAAPNWLLFGERKAATDFYYGDEIRAWETSGVLQRLDLACSRDQAERRYVQHALCEAADEVRTWIAEGASVLVCGSLAGMAPAVEAALIEILDGEETLDRLRAEGRYRRDVY